MATKGNTISVLVSTANSMAGELLANALSRQARFQVVGSVTSGDEVLGIVQSKKVDVALISAALSDGPASGFSLARRLRECAPDLKPVMLLENPESCLVVDAFRVGAKGVFYPSTSTFKELVRCVDRVHEGHIWANCDQLRDVMEAFASLAPLKVVNADGMRLLTKKEEMVVRLAADGMLNRNIADEMKISEHTVKNHMFHIFDKLGVSSRVELVLYAVSTSKRIQFSAKNDSDDDEAPSLVSLKTAANAGRVAAAMRGIAAD